MVAGVFSLVNPARNIVNRLHVNWNNCVFRKKITMTNDLERRRELLSMLKQTKRVKLYSSLYPELIFASNVNVNDLIEAMELLVELTEAYNKSIISVQEKYPPHPSSDVYQEAVEKIVKDNCKMFEDMHKHALLSPSGVIINWADWIKYYENKKK